MTESKTQTCKRPIGDAMLKDQHRLKRLLRDWKQCKDEKKKSKLRHKFDQQLSQSAELADRRLAIKPQPKFDQDLPVLARRQEIAELIEKHQVVIVCGETGSGKSTQLPQICLELGRGIKGMIGHTQPRRLAARSVAARVAEELGVALGEQVGYKIRFSDQTKPGTYIKLMTDGMLLSEAQTDRFLNQYDTIIVDEAHERSLNIDFLLGNLKRLLSKRQDLKVIITSATIDASRYSHHFRDKNEGPAPVINVEGRTYPVEVRYRPHDSEESSSDVDWTAQLILAVEEITAESHGDILVFLPTERDIRIAAKTLAGHVVRLKRPIDVLPLYGRMSQGDQVKIFGKSSSQRVILATNVAESSLTVPGIVSVIDFGTARLSRYSARSQMQRLPIEPISKASADQRKGRCGRVAPGICLRMYSQEDYNTRDDFTQPEIQRTNLASVILQTEAFGLGDVAEFPFLDPPKPGMIREGYKTLFEIGAIDDQNQLTDIGKKLSKLPVDPRIGRMILAAADEHCLPEVLIIASGLEVQDPRDRPVDQQQEADKAHLQFKHEHSDFLTLLNLWDFAHDLKKKLSNNQFRKACRQNFLSHQRLREWSDVYRQLTQLAEEAGMKRGERKRNEDAIHRSLLTGLLCQVAFLTDSGDYCGSGGNKRFLWPGSVLAKKKPKWIVAAELVETSQRFARMVARINPVWIEPLAGHLIKRQYSEPHWDGQPGAVFAFEKVLLLGMPIVNRRRVRYAHQEPALCREMMIQEGLVTGDFPTTGNFLVANQRLLEDLEALQARTRRLDLLRGEDARFEFYDQRIPNDCVDAVRLEKWRKKAEKDNPNLLKMTKKDLLFSESMANDITGFPHGLVIEGQELLLEYHLEPGSEEDGIILTTPLKWFRNLKPELLDWLVPGLMEEKIATLIKGLPKHQRTRLVPAGDTAKEIASKIKFGQGAFLTIVADAFRRIADDHITPADLKSIELPRHLQMQVKVVNEQGEVLGRSRSLSELNVKLFPKPVPQAPPPKPTKLKLSDVAQKTQWHKDGLKSWNFGRLPELIELKVGTERLRGAPAVVDQYTAVSLRLVETKEEAIALSKLGLVRLFQFRYPERLTTHVNWLPSVDQFIETMEAQTNLKSVKSQLCELLARLAIEPLDPLPRTTEQFDSACSRGVDRINYCVQDLTAWCVRVLEVFPQARELVSSFTSPKMGNIRAELEEQLELIFSPMALQQASWSRLAQLPRYLKGIEVRCQKLKVGGYEQDRVHQKQLNEFLERLTLIKHPAASMLEEYREYIWMTEEYRISLFAQKLGTPEPISPKRLERQWKKLSRAVDALGK